MIRVVNVRGLHSPDQRAGIVYVGRAFAGWPASPLANPFKLVLDTPVLRLALVRRYREWLQTWPAEKLAAALDELWRQTDCGQLPLGCWCAPGYCHADALADLLAERFVPAKVQT